MHLLNADTSKKHADVILEFSLALNCEGYVEDCSLCQRKALAHNEKILNAKYEKGNVFKLQ